MFFMLMYNYLNVHTFFRGGEKTQMNQHSSALIVKNKNIYLRKPVLLIENLKQKPGRVPNQNDFVLDLLEQT